ncbi:hypothetical protein FMM80_16905 [Schaedlerella arabinosiphila]|uniref:Uncharacterized protein n=1 Tax=Schaedlerella arabinosiphila TaxID=2044587 RepID=A0A9X5H745_9FIRM|nr:hypothetical protein [Schaedlerella arabinosiphila]MCI9604248.1 hypothetical protein [Ruminococcus sp.]NDO70239.1 hypothetical protein [Schaedlerella arabinosiphila]
MKYSKQVRQIETVGSFLPAIHTESTENRPEINKLEVLIPRLFLDFPGKYEHNGIAAESKNIKILKEGRRVAYAL